MYPKKNFLAQKKFLARKKILARKNSFEIFTKDSLKTADKILHLSFPILPHRPVFKVL